MYWKIIGFQYSFCSYSTTCSSFALRFVSLFQYSFCSYSTRREKVKQSYHESFNTASVLIQQGMKGFVLGGIKVSIQLLFLFNKQQRENKYLQRDVSIQLLFLFNSEEMQSLHKNIVSIQLLFLFNTEDCSSLQAAFTFQYSFCSYSTHFRQSISGSGVRFQYSFCSYSTINFTAIIIYRIY